MKGRAAEPSTEPGAKGTKGTERGRREAERRRKTEAGRAAERKPKMRKSTRKAPVRRNVEEGKGRNRGQVAKILNGRERGGRTAEETKLGGSGANGRMDEAWKIRSKILKERAAPEERLWERIREARKETNRRAE